MISTRNALFSVAALAAAANALTVASPASMVQVCAAISHLAPRLERMGPD